MLPLHVYDDVHVHRDDAFYGPSYDDDGAMYKIEEELQLVLLNVSTKCFISDFKSIILLRRHVRDVHVPFCLSPH